MPFPAFTVERIETVFTQLEKLRYRNLIPLDEFSVFTGDTGSDVNFAPSSVPLSDAVMKKGDIWKGRDTYLWLSRNIVFPDTWKGADVLAFFDFGKTGGGNTAGFEALLYVNGYAYQGVDANHREVFFDLAKLGTTIRIDLRLWSGLEGGGPKVIQIHQFKNAFIACLDRKTDDLYYLSKNIIQTLRVLDQNDPVRYDLETVLTKAFCMTDFTDPSSESFYESIARSDDFLNKELAGMKGTSSLKVDCVGHSHIDMAWLWRMKHTREKAARTFSTVNRLMERYPEYIFLHTSAQLYDFVKHDFPDIYKQIKERVAQKKWEPSGSMWVEADCNIPSGESLVRQILYGKRFFKKEFDYDNTFLWLPDVFGYSGALPQILKKSGIDTFITTKISWNEINAMPYDTFSWRGIDGSEVLTHFITTPDMDEKTRFYTYNGTITPKTVTGIWKNYRNKDLTKELLLCYGWGDGGGGVDRDMLENRRQLEKIPGLPEVETSNVTSYLKKLHAAWDDSNTAANRPVWDGELYFEFHRGTYTSQARNKKANRKAELSYRTAEILQTFAAARSGNWMLYAEKEFVHGWQLILRNQFHDIIPGSSIHEVYEDSAAEYREIADIAEELTDRAVKTLTGADCNDLKPVTHATVFSVFNNACWPVSGIVTLPAFDTAVSHLVDDSGSEIPVQKTADGTCCAYVCDLQSLSFTRLSVVPGSTTRQNSAFCVNGKSVDTPFYTITWNDSGYPEHILDKRSGREVLAGTGNLLEIFEDKPRQFDAWNLEETIDLKREIISDFLGTEIIEDGPCHIRIRFSWKYDKSSIRQDMVLYAHSPRIDYETTVDWQERNKLLKAAFPVHVRALNARYDIQYGSLERPVHQNTSWDFAKFEVPAHQWADLSERGFGVAILNDCKYGYDIKKNVMRISLLRSAEYPDTEADRGIQQFTYSLFVHESEWYDAGIVQAAWNLNNPLSAVLGSVPDQVCNFITMQSPYVALDAVKKTEDGNRLLFRFHEYSGGKSKIDFTVNVPVFGWYEADLMENKTGEFRTGNRVTTELAPFEIYTVIFEMKK